MINEETKRKLKELNISELSVALEQQQKDPLSAKLSFDERFQRLVDYLYQEKYNCKIQRLIKTAKFRFPQADRQSLYFDGRILNHEAVTELMTCSTFIPNIVLYFKAILGQVRHFWHVHSERKLAVNR